MHRLLALSLGFAGLILATQAGFGQGLPGTQCGPRAQILTLLAERYGETRLGMGLSGPQSVVELFAAEGGSWTMTITLPDGRTCLLLAGQDWDRAPPAALPARGDPV